MEVHLAGLDLGEVEDVVDQREQVPAGAQHALERLELVFPLQVARVLVQHLGDADDRVQRRAQLVRHVGQELRLVLARRLQLLALLPNLLEQTRVLDGKHRLAGERLQQRDHRRRKLARDLAPDHQRADHQVLAQERHGEHRAHAFAQQRIAHPAVFPLFHVRNLEGLRFTAHWPTADSPRRIRDSRSIRT